MLITANVVDECTVTKPFWRVRVVSRGEDRVFLRPTIYYFFPQGSLPPRHPAYPPTCPVDIVIHAYHTGLNPERDWSPFLEQISSIPNLQSILIALPTYDDVQSFWEGNNDAMQYLMTSTWVRYVYSHANNNRAWAIVDPVTLERTGTLHMSYMCVSSLIVSWSHQVMNCVTLRHLSKSSQLL